MPELPEVETVRATLEHQIIGETIKGIDIYYDKIIENVDPMMFKTKLINETLQAMKRYGKYLIFIFEHVSIVAHLRMEGKFFIKPSDEKVVKHEHIVFRFASGRSLRYHDTRKFGKMVFLETTEMFEIMKYPALAKLGKEANDPTFLPAELYEKLHLRKIPLKVALLDQEDLAGLGNIYVDEVLFATKLNPLMMCSMITIEDAKSILDASRTILTKAIASGGTTIRSYTSSLGVTGLFQLSLMVHTKEHIPCSNCGTTIIKTVVGGRGTYICPHCQALRKPHVMGITGGIATGKSVVTDYLKKQGYQVIDADVITHQLLKTPKVIAMIKDAFGDVVVTNNQINRAALANLIFDNEELRQRLNKIIHPLVKEKIKAQIATSNQKQIFVDVPLLFEASFEDLCDEVITVYTDPATNVKRLKERDHIDQAYAEKKIASQLSLDEKCRKSNYIIDNSSDLCYTYNQIDEIIKTLK